jgi:hypothetical protein
LIVNGNSSPCRPYSSRRGFKREANEFALEMREELGLRAESPLCPFSLAQHLEIRVVSLMDLCQQNPDVARRVSYFAERKPSAFSTVTVWRELLTFA